MTVTAGTYFDEETSRTTSTLSFQSTYRSVGRSICCPSPELLYEEVSLYVDRSYVSFSTGRAVVAPFRLVSVLLDRDT